MTGMTCQPDRRTACASQKASASARVANCRAAGDGSKVTSPCPSGTAPGATVKPPMVAFSKAHVGTVKPSARSCFVVANERPPRNTARKDVGAVVVMGVTLAGARRSVKSFFWAVGAVV